MHRGGVPSHVTTQKVNFYRISEIVINFFTQILRDILLFYYQRPKDLQQKIKDVHLEHKLKKNISTIMDGDGYEKCDISILYTLLRNTCQIIPPTITERRRWGWGGDDMPSRECITLGDDIERIRIMRNRICTHVYNTEMEDGKFEKYYEISLGVCKRLTGKFGTKDYVKELESLKTCRMEADSSLDALTEKLKEMIESNESLRDFVRKYTRVVSSEINELRHVVKQLRDEKATSEDFFKRNQKGDIQSMTVNALDLIRRMQTEPGNTDVRDRSRQIIDAVISDTCKRGGINLQVLETRFSEIFESSFKRTVGFKLLDYLTKHPDKFTMYKHAANQWKVVLAGHDLPVHAKRRKKSKQKTASKRNTQVEDFDVSIFYKDQTEKVKMDEIQDVEPDISPRDDSDNIEIFHSTESLSYSSEGWDEDYDEGNNEDHQYNDDDVAYHQNKEGEKMVEAKISDPNALKSIELSKDVFSKTFPKKLESVNTEISSMSYPKSKIQAREYTIEKKKIRHPESQGYGTSSSLKTKSKPKKLSLLPTSDSMTQKISEFLEKVNNFEKTSESFALVVGKTDIVPNIDSLALIPWLCVFDFDMNSREDGLYSVLEGHINTVHPCTLKDRPRFSFSYTYWCQLRGNCQIPDTCMDCDARIWLNEMRRNIEDHLESLAEYISYNTKLKVILFWPKDKEDIKFVNKFLTLLDAIILLDIFVIYPEMLEEPAGLGQIESIYKLQVSYEIFYSYLKRNIKKVKPRTPAKYLLPTFDRCNNPGIDEFTASHLQEDLNILYMKSVQERTYGIRDIKEEGENFLRGGTLRWFVYYECDEDAFFDVKRDLMTNILCDIRTLHIQNSRSAILEVFHTPGAGGTTLSQRILWELHTEIPCVQVKSNIQSTITDIVEHIKLIYEKTQLPILVLLDGQDDSKVRHIYDQCGLQSISVLVLHVQRIRKEPKDANLIRGKYWIKGQVTNREATKFCLRYLEYCDTEEKKDNLQTITDNVTKGELHHVYEFGLTTFAHEYEGVKEYVKGYLQLKPNSVHKLDSTQKLLGYLSFVYYYGQMSLPCELFSKLLERVNGVTFEDLPFEVRQLVVTNDSYQHKGYIRICHQIVAKEILEQILARNVSTPHKSGQTLSDKACRNLVDFGHDFINEMNRKFDKKIHWKKNKIVEILNKIFLHRETKDIDEYGLQKIKPRFSRFFTDIEKYSSKQDRIEIMKKMVSCCAENPNYHAHLGRMYTLYYPGEETALAEKHFKRAISICEKEHDRANRHSTQFPEDQFSNSTVFHMYGMHFYHRLCRITHDLEDITFEKNIEIVLEYARNACSHFETSCENSFPGIGQSYGLLGEIMVRLEVCNYINKKMKVRLSEYVRSDQMSSVVVFVRESMVQICELITQCYSTLDIDELPPTMSKQVCLYKELFKGQDLAELCSLEGPLDFSRRRHIVTQIKLKYCKGNRYDIFSLDETTPSKEIVEIISHLEDNFKDLEAGNIGYSVGLIESDYKDWMNAIRLNQYDRKVRLEEVYRKLQLWHDRARTPISKLYVFIVCATMTILNKDVNHFFEAKEMLEEVKKYKHHFPRANKPREWLGNCSGIKCLIPSCFVKQKPDSGVDEVEFIRQTELKPKFLKGSISGSNQRPHSGTISLRVCNGSQFEVFFAPDRTKEKLIGAKYVSQRVEFILAFNVSHGFMAYNVKRIETIPCGQCSRKVEFVTDQDTAECKCGYLVQKLEEKDNFRPDSS